MQDFKNAGAQGYTVEHFKKRVTLGQEYPNIVGELFALIAQARIYGLTKNLNSAVRNFTESLLFSAQVKHSGAEIQKVIQSLLG